jgi:DNA mismatch endonuclease (patch repair protein)
MTRGSEMERALRDRLRGGEFSRVAPRHSALMKAVRGTRNRTTELRFRAALMREGIRGWRVRPPGLPGSPDFVFPQLRLAVFVDGCFWHGCPRCGHVPRTNSAFWRAKIARNRQRDRLSATRLRRAGFAVERFWEHDLQAGPQQTLRRFLTAIASQECNIQRTIARK